MIIKKPFSTNSNKVKKCDCENKTGPKPFDYQDTKKTKSKSN